MATHDLVPLEQALLPSNLALAFGLEQPEQDLKTEARPQTLDPHPNGSVGPPMWPVQSSFAPIAGGIPQAAPALQASQPPRMGYEPQLNGAHVPLQYQVYSRSVQQAATLPSTAGPGAATGAAAGRPENKADAGVAMTKKPRVAWTADLHKRFVDAVTELGVHTAVPKAIMQVQTRHLTLLRHIPEFAQQCSFGVSQTCHLHPFVHACTHAAASGRYQPMPLYPAPCRK